MKICSHCKQEKLSSSFWKNKGTKDGYLTICKKCLGWKGRTNELRTEFSEKKKANNESMLRYYYRNKVARNMSNRIRASLNGLVKSKHWEDLVGYTLEELKTHLEKRFQPKMSWNNHGLHGWHIHHIRPVHTFNITSDSCEDFKRCWRLENLTPIWANDHPRGSGKGVKMNKKTTVQVDIETHLELKKIAESSRMTLSEVIKHLLKEYRKEVVKESDYDEDLLLS